MSPAWSVTVIRCRYGAVATRIVVFPARAGALIAAGVPLLLAGTAVATAISLLALLGERNWYQPRWLARLAR